MATLYLIDASCYVFRAYYSLSPDIVDGDGRCANAVLGFGLFLCELLERRSPSHVAICFDECLGSGFRHQLYPAYKAQRPEAPADLKHQFARCRELVGALGIAHFGSASHEADDLIGTLAQRTRAPGLNVVYVSADKDLAQLVQGHDRLWDPPRRRWLDAQGVHAQMGVHPWQVVDFLALAGDPVDNIPGVPGIGAKTAARLLGARRSLEGIYADLDAVLGLGLRGAARVRRLLGEHRDQAWLSRKLAAIDCAAPLTAELDELAWAGCETDALQALGLPAMLTRRARRLLPVLDLPA